MKIFCALVAIIVGLTLLPMRVATADEALHHIKPVTPLPPVLRSLVMKYFPKDPELREFLIPDELEVRPGHLPILYGATFRANAKGDLGAIIEVEGSAWCGTSGCLLYIFLRRNGKWKRAGDSRFSSGPVDVLRTTDHGFYRLDLGFERDCPDEGKSITDGIMIWKGKEYDRLHPCP